MIRTKDFQVNKIDQAQKINTCFLFCSTWKQKRKLYCELEDGRRNCNVDEYKEITLLSMYGNGKLIILWAKYK